MFFEIVDEFEIDFHVLIVIEGQLGQQCMEVFDEVAEHRDLAFLLDEADRPSDQPLLYGCAPDALVDQRETE